MLFLPVVFGQANVTGNCATGRIDFNPSRIYRNAGNPNGGDYTRHEMTIDYGHANFEARPGGGADLKITRNTAGGPGNGIRLSSLRYMKYGRITARMRAITAKGLITSFITMSDVKDEIDWEFVGANPTQVQTNIFYRGIEEFGIHGTTVELNRSISETFDYTIDWTDKAITFAINGLIVRVYENNERAVSPRTPAGQRWYPNTASKVQIGIWDGGASSAPGTVSWAGGPTDWAGRNEYSASFDYIDIQCYNDQMQPVDKWPDTADNRSPVVQSSNLLSELTGGSTTQTSNLIPKPNNNQKTAAKAAAQNTTESSTESEEEESDLENAPMTSSIKLQSSSTPKPTTTAEPETEPKEESTSSQATPTASAVADPPNVVFAAQLAHASSALTSSSSLFITLLLLWVFN